MKRTWIALTAGMLVLNSSLPFGRTDETPVDLPAPLDREIDFRRDVRPLLAAHCWACHNTDYQESGLQLDRRDAMLMGGDMGRVVVVGDSGASRLIHTMAGTDPELSMPPGEDRLSAEQIGILRAWIDQGCVWPADEQSPEPENTHWAYQPLQPSPVPEVRLTEWPINPIDHFVLAALEADQWEPSPEADRYTLIRRLYLDLLGLLPPIDQVDAFVQDASDDAYERLVDRLLLSPHFGERWGRHWLDMARYADSDGYEKDRHRPDAYRYRDWVIDAINQDLPFDQFTIEQLAGDLLPDASPMQRLATAFHRQTLTNTEGGVDQEEFRVEACFDRTETTATVWLGLTVGCARCHSHKYDAISQREYFQLFAMFNNADEQTSVVPKSAREVAAYEQARLEYDAKIQQLTDRLRAEQDRLGDKLWRTSDIETEEPIPDAMTPLLAQPAEALDDEQRQQLRDYFSRFEPSTRALLDELERVRSEPPPKPEMTVRVLHQRTKDPRTTFVFRRGEFLQPQLDLEVQPGGLATLPPLLSRNGDGVADRLDLARWLVSSDNPLPPRVTVNQLWRQLLGQGLVRTSEDFGVRGERPTHPELLDWLALDLLGRTGDADRDSTDQTWSRKALIKRIVMSATYRQSSRHRPELQEIDPTNTLLARQNRVRVEGEIVRDISLDAAGLLSRKIGGPSVYPPLPPGIAELSYAGNFKWTESKGEDRFRRGMYTFFKRTAPHPNLIVFDCPDANVTQVQRQTSNTPLQALTTLNNTTFAEAAQALARRMLSEPADDERQRLALAFRYCLARPAGDQELDQLALLLDETRQWYAQHPEQAGEMIGEDAATGSPPEQNAAWIAVARVLMNLDEFLTRE